MDSISLSPASLLILEKLKENLMAAFILKRYYFRVSLVAQ